MREIPMPEMIARFSKSFGMSGLLLARPDTIPGMSEAASRGSPPRILPPLTAENRAFWTGGAGGELRIQHCEACRRWVHPPASACPICSGALATRPASGRGTLFTFTVNHQAFRPEVPPPYVIAIVELAEQADLRIPTNLVDCDPDRLTCGMPVRVCFEPHGEIFVPLFEPDD
jgi:uncharacterized OB-fold protein